MTQIGSAEFKFTVDDSDLDRSLGRISRTVKQEGEKAEKAITQHLRTGGRAGGGAFVRQFEQAAKGLDGALKNTISNVGQGIGQGLGMAITGAITGAVGSGLNALLDTTNLKAFDAASRKAATLTADIEGLEKASYGLANELGNTVSATEALDSSYDVLSAGFSKTTDVMEILKASQKGAIGGFSDLNTVANATTSVLNAYGMEASKATDLVNQFAGTQNAGKITIAEYANNIGKLASTASQAGVAIEEINAIIAAATVKGVRVESAFDGVRAAIASVLKPSTEASKLANDLGIQFDSAALKSGGLVGILQSLKDKGQDSPEILMKLFGSVEAVAAIAPVAGDGLKDYAKALDIVKNTNADEAFQKVAGGLEQQQKVFQNILTDLDTSLKSGSFGQAFGSALAFVNKGLLATINYFKQLSPEAQKSIGVIAAVTVGLGVLGTVATGVALAIKAKLVSSLVAAVTAAATAAAPFVASAAAVVGVLSAVGVAISQAVSWWDGLSDAQKQAVQENQPIQAAIGNTIDAVRALGQWVSDNIPIWINWAQAIAGAAISLAGQVVDAIGVIIEAINAFIVLLRETPNNVRQSVDIVVGLFNVLKDSVINSVRFMAQDVIRWFQDMASKVISTVQSWGNGIQSNVTKAIGLFQNIKRTVDDFGTAAVSRFNSMLAAFNPVKKVLGDIWDLAKKAGEALKGLGKFLPTTGTGGGSPLDALKLMLGMGVPATSPGGYTVYSTTSGASRQISNYSQSLPHHTYQHALSVPGGESRDYTLFQGGSSRVPVPSPLSGIVDFAGWAGGYGNTVVVQAANGLQALIGHLDSIAVKAGQIVQFGQSIGIQGSTGRSTGDHVHIEALPEVIRKWVDHITGASLQSSVLLPAMGLGGGDHGDPEKIKKESKKSTKDKDTRTAAQKAADRTQQLAEEMSKLEAGNLDAIKEKLGLITGEIELQVKRVGTDLKLGLRSQLEAEEAILAIREDGMAKLEEQNKKLQYMATITKDPAVKLEAEELSEGIRIARAEIEETKKALTELRFNKFVEEYQAAQQQISIAQQEYQNNVALGLIEEEAGLQALLEKRRAIADQLAESLPNLQLFMATAADPTVVLNAEELLQRIRAISAETQSQQDQIEQAQKAQSTQAQISEKLKSIGQSAKDGFVDAIVEGKKFADVLKDIGKQLLKLALNFALKSLFGGIGLNFRNGGTVLNFANGGTVLGAITSALQREGPNSVLAALTPGEEVLSLQNGDAQTFRSLKSSGMWNAIKRVENFAVGGTVGKTARPVSKALGNSKQELTVTRIERMGDFVSFDQVMEMFAIRDPQVAMAGAQIVETKMQSSNYRKRNGL